MAETIGSGSAGPNRSRSADALAGLDLIQPWTSLSFDERWRRERRIDVAFNVVLAVLGVLLLLTVALLFASAGIFGVLADSV